MRAILCAVLIGWVVPAQADECGALTNAMIERKTLVDRVATWRGNPPPPVTACGVFTELVNKTGSSIVEISRLRSQCDTPVYLISSLAHELYLLQRAEARTCRLASSEP